VQEPAVEEIEGQAALQRQLRSLPAKGPAAVLAQEPQAAPEKLKKSPAPLFHAASRKIRLELGAHGNRPQGRALPRRK
jgi:hypothetical protein